MKYDKTKLLLVSTIILGLGTGGVLVVKNLHSMKATSQVLMFASKHRGASIEANNKTDDSANTSEAATNSGEAEKKDEVSIFESLPDVELVKYTAKEKDTIWGIARTFMPEYRTYDLGDKKGVIDYIGRKNNLNKDKNGDYIVYGGLKLIIPKQKNIALNSTGKNTTVVKNTDSSAKKQTSTVKPTTGNTVDAGKSISSSTTTNSSTTSSSSTGPSSTVSEPSSTTSSNKEGSSSGNESGMDMDMNMNIMNMFGGHKHK